MSDPTAPHPSEMSGSLPDSIEFFRALFEKSPEPMFIADSSGRLIAVNEQGIALMGYSISEFRGMTMADLVHPEDLAREGIPLEELRRGRVLKRERRLRRRDGSFIFVENRFRMLPDGHILGITIDITERKQAESDLRQSEKKYRDLYRNMLDASAAVNLDGEIIEFNAAFRDLVGYDAKAIYSLAYEDITPAKWHGMEKVILETQVLQRGYSDLYEKEYIHQDGRVFPIELRTYLIRDDAGAPAGFWAIIRDITERKQAEAAIRREMVFTEDIINSLPGIFYMYDDTNRLVRWNKRLEQDTAYPPEELKGIDVLAFFTEAHKPYIMSRMAMVFTEGESFAEAPLLTRDGREIPYFFTGQKVVLEGRQYLIGVGIDVTEHKQTAAEKEMLQAQLYQARKMESIGRLAGGVAHDFNNMLSAILGQAELAMRHCHSSDPIHEGLRVIADSANRSADLVRQLLAFARKQTVAPVLLNLNKNVGDMLNMLQRLIGENIALDWKPEAGLWPVKMDPSQIDQVLVNLCVNARDAISGAGRIVIEARNAVFDDAWCAAHPHFNCGEYVRLSVRDDGCGMDQEMVAYIFEPFYTTKHARGGSGLGLATVYGIVRQNDGFVNVRTEPGKGAAMDVYLPRFSGDTENIAGAGPSETDNLPRGRGETVLLVEDEPVILDVGREMLEALGYNVIPAATPGEALHQAAARKDEITLLITDVVMPEMNGRDLAEKISQIKPGLKCLFISGYTSDVIAHHNVLDDGIQFLQKPFSMNELAAKVHQVMTER